MTEESSKTGLDKYNIEDVLRDSENKPYEDDIYFAFPKNAVRHKKILNLETVDISVLLMLCSISNVRKDGISFVYRIDCKGLLKMFGKSRVNARTSVDRLIKSKLIETSGSLDGYFSVKIDLSGGFTKISYDELDKLLSFSNRSSWNIVETFLTIISNIHEVESDESDKKNVFFGSLSLIKLNIDRDLRSIGRYVKELEEEKLLASYLTQQRDLRYAKKLYISRYRNRLDLRKFVEKDMRSPHGFIGSIIDEVGESTDNEQQEHTS